MKHRHIILNLIAIIVISIPYLCVIFFMSHNVQEIEPTVTSNEEVEIIEVKDHTYEMVYYDVPMSRAWQNWVVTVCNSYKVEPELIMAICYVESKYNKDAVDYASGTHHGLMQLGPSARSYINNVLQRELDYFDEFDNVEGGIIYMAGILETTPDYHKALMVYNCGGGAAKTKWSNGEVSTSYSKAVMNEYEKLKSEKKGDNWLNEH